MYKIRQLPHSSPKTATNISITHIHTCETMYYYQHEDLLHPATHLHRTEYSFHPPEPALLQPSVDGNNYLRETLAVLTSDVAGGPTTTASASPSSLPTYLHRPSPKQMSLAGSHRQLTLPGKGLRESVGLEVGPVRRVCSTGDLDLQRMGMNGFQHGQRSESSLGPESGGVEHMTSRVGRYTAEERKERIERYRSKRNQRNFHKKIKYACRKTLADSRPRVRGRFARNDEAGESSGCSWVTTGGEEEEEEEDWVNFLEAFSTNLIPLDGIN